MICQHAVTKHSAKLASVTSHSPILRAIQRRAIALNTDNHNNMAGGTGTIVKKNYISDKCLQLYVVALGERVYITSG